VKRSQLLRDAYVLIPADVPDELIATLDPSSLKPGWNSPEENRITTDIGDQWYDQSMSVALRVPSGVLRAQFNVLLNPRHENWKRIRVGVPTPFLFDSRLAE
jgi:RES domain-containing protein